MDFYFKQVTDADLKELAGFANLTRLNVFLRFKHLSELGVDGKESDGRGTQGIIGATQVTGAGLKDLASLKNLTRLRFDTYGVTDAGLMGLATLTIVTSLDLSTMNVTDAGLKELASLTKLTELKLGGAKRLAQSRHQR